MIKSELILRIAARHPHLPRRDVGAAVDAILDRISDGLLVGERVELRGFGALLVRGRGARLGRNPKTGTQVHVAQKKMFAFKIGKGMHARLNRPPSIAEPMQTALSPSRRSLSQRDSHAQTNPVVTF